MGFLPTWVSWQWRLIEKGSQHGSLDLSSKHLVSALSAAKGAQLRGGAFAKDLLAVGIVSRAEKHSQVALLGGNAFKGERKNEAVLCRCFLNKKQMLFV